jgi:hypothetical protein
MNRDTKIKVFNTCVRCVLLYGYDTWLITNELRRKIQTFINRCLRYILGIWWPRIISNRELWQLSGETYINMEIPKQKFGWTGHMLRKDDEQPTKVALQCNPQGNRGRGRPRNRWRRSTLREAGRRRSELRYLVADWDKWKMLVDNLCS